VRLGDSRLGTFEFEVAAGDTTDVGSIDFSHGSIAGTVSWHGSVISGLEAQTPFAWAEDTSGNLLVYEYVHPDGSYLLTNVATGTRTVSLAQHGCTQPEGLLAQASASVVPAATTTVDFDITDTAGKVIGAITVNGSPASGLELYIDGLCGSFGGDQDGKFAHYLPPGSYTASVRVTGSLLGTFDFSVLVGEITDVDVGTTPAGIDVSVDLSGGDEVVGGLSLTFAEVLQSGQTTVVESGAGPPPDTGFRIVGIAGAPRYWDINTTAEYVPPILVCIHYDPTEVNGNESNLRLRHDDGSGWEDITTSIDEEHDTICGLASSLSPFAVFEPLDGDTDADEDGVNDADDECPQTQAGAIVDADGCSVDDRCPCDGAWQHHGNYVSCVRTATSVLLDAGLITGRQRGALVSAAARSDCGK
jgi:hypothetical protein